MVGQLVHASWGIPQIDAGCRLTYYLVSVRACVRVQPRSSRQTRVAYELRCLNYGAKRNGVLERKHFARDGEKFMIAEF